METRKSLTKTSARGLRTKDRVTAQEREIMAVGKAHHWPFRVLGVAPVPAQPIFLNDWWLVPAHLDSNPIPERAMERVRALHEAGVTAKAFVIAHQAEKQLAPPSGTRIISPLEYWEKVAGTHAVNIFKAVGTVIAVLAPVALAIVGTGLLVSLAAATALLADPVLCAVTEDDVWIQIDEWMA